jgi:GntR family transcriptional regulator
MGQQPKKMVQLDRTNRRPLYDQLKAILLQDIRRRESGEILPTEKEIGEQFSVSRQTVRLAMKELTQEGYLVRVAGRGTFVAIHKVVRDNSWALENFNQEMHQYGIEPETQILNLEVLPGSEIINRRLGLDPAAKVLFLCRLRFADGWPLVALNSYLPYDKVMGLENQKKILERTSLHAYITSKYHYNFKNAYRSVEALPAPNREAEILKILPGSPILYSETVWQVAEGFAVEYVREWYRGDRSQFTMILGKQDAAASS